jgi:glycosyltransferase involved in cell wall biosynthesis
MTFVAAPPATSSVSIGIPTFNRAKMLERAVRSVLAQTHSNLELVISDNASNDETEALCRTIAAHDPRVRYMRQESNIGQFPNFNVLYGALRSPYVMVLADDDWLEPDYLGRCVAALREEPGCAAVSGRGRYWRGEAMLSQRGLSLQLCQPTGAERVQALARSIGEGKGETSTFFGVMPAEVLRRARPMPTVLAGDILLVARVAFQGTVRTLDDVHLNRSVGGTSVSMASTVAAHGLPPRHARWPDLVIARDVLRDVGRQHAVYKTLRPASRLGCGLSSALAVINWRSVAWHATAPTAASLGRRTRGRWVWLGYDRVTRALGAEGFQGQLLVEQSRAMR